MSQGGVIPGESGRGELNASIRYLFLIKNFSGEDSPFLKAGLILTKHNKKKFKNHNDLYLNYIDEEKMGNILIAKKKGCIEA